MIYGSSRLGSYNGKTLEGKRTLGNKKYELFNHLGNVLSVISDNKIGIGSNGVADYYEPYIVSESDYYPFGMAMKERSFASSAYRYGMNGQEKSDELDENGNSYTAEFWQYSATIARRWNVDPVVKPYESSYAAFAGNPIWFADPNGDSTVYVTNQKGEEYDEVALKATAENAQTIANENGANFITYKAISREALIKEIKSGKVKREVDAIYVYEVGGFSGSSVGGTTTNISGDGGWDDDFGTFYGGSLYGGMIYKISKEGGKTEDVWAEATKEAQYLNAGVALAHESLVHAYPMLINVYMFGGKDHTKHNRYGDHYDEGLAGTDQTPTDATKLTQGMIKQNYSLSNTNIVSNISSYMSYIHYSNKQRSLEQEISRNGGMWLYCASNETSMGENLQIVRQKFLMYKLLKDDAKSNIKVR